MPEVNALVALAPTPSKRRPTGVSLTTTVTTAVVRTATYTGMGMPSHVPPPILDRRWVVVVGIPALYQSPGPNGSAFVPGVATIGLRRMRPMRKPLTSPAATAAAIAMPTAGRSRLFTPAGYLVTITT